MHATTERFPLRLPLSPRDAMLARYTLWLCVSPSVCLHVPSRNSAERLNAELWKQLHKI